MRILLTGATGYLGSHLAKMLHGLSHEIVIFKRETSSLDKLSEIKDSVSFVHNVDELSDIDAFFHCATSYGRNGEDSSQLKTVNFDFPISILKKIQKDGLIFFNMGTSLPSDLNDYSKTKNEFRDFVKVNHSEFKMINLSLEQFFGPNDGTFISFVLGKLYSNDENLALTKGEQVRDFIYIDDLVSAVKTIFVKSTDWSNGYYNFSVGEGSPPTIKEAVLMANELIGNSKINLGWGELPYRENEVMHSVSNTAELKKLGWSPKYSFKEGLEKTIKAYKK